MKRSTLETLLASLAAGRAAVLTTDLRSGEQRLFEPLDDTPPENFPADRWAEAVRAVRDDRSRLSDDPGQQIFLNVFNPPARLVVVGAVHVAQPLVRMAALAGLAVTVIDPRGAWGSEARFADVEVLSAWPDEALADLGVDHRTAVVTLTHDAKLDDPALVAALRSDAFYVGALGSRRTHAKRVARLEEAGFTAEEIARIHAPIGLPIGARTPAEIAVAILAEVIQRLRTEPPTTEP
ncbi:hypothetical protein BH23GEM4_BH23GEM4_18240 [soil metagenome]